MASKKQYPLDEEFLRWQRTDDNEDRNPYHDRYTALTRQLNLGERRQRWLLGRALYHLAQRRGFLSNRKEAGDDTEGKVKTDIKNLSDEMTAAGCSYLGEYFYELYQRKERIRGKYTSRNEHYLAEFDAICNRQQLPDECRKALHRAIFFQRDLKSQKGSVGRCTFEPTKSRCPVSHPRFEEFRMLQFINNIRITEPNASTPRPLTTGEIEAIRPLFSGRAKPTSILRRLPANRRQGKIRLQGGSHGSSLPLQFCRHGHRIGMSRHGIAYGHLWGRLAS